MEPHAIGRGPMRYGLELKKRDLAIMRDLIVRRKRAILIGTGRNGTCFYLLKYKNKPVKVLYCIETRKIVTLYPLDIDECNTYFEQLESLNAKITKE